mmetsp:Transcript_109660/g.338505  ORF Transcript_109660/g.338505 Transcript_109660/m.338505 type:complete len:616 (+) Transcript_109660:66-1913(+)
MDSPTERLLGILSRHPFLYDKDHMLHPFVERARQAVEAESSDAGDALDLVERKLDTEQKMLMAAFQRFCSAGEASLGRQELKRMNDYLGFPSSDTDIRELITRLDRNGSGRVDFREFEAYVGGMGGSMKLFEERRKRIGGAEQEGDPESLKMSLLEAGISEVAQASWRLVVAPSEFQEAAKLLPCQKSALAHIRGLARANHERALPQVQRRAHGLGFTDDALWMALAWIRELAPVIVHVDLDRMLGFLERDTHYRNQFETKTSGATLDVEARTRWERGLFGSAYDGPGVRSTDRCKYAVLNVMNDYRGVVRCNNYGDSYVVLRDVRLRCTCSPEDSAAMKADSLAVFDFYAHVLLEYSDEELRETLTIASSTEAALLGDSEKVGLMKYKEAQVHGPIRFDTHVERLVASDRHRASEGRLRALCKKHGWAFSWKDEERDRMEREDLHKLSGDLWRDRMAKLEEAAGAAGVPTGYCRMACGRRVCPGTTRSGKPFSTCCRGCVMGFGHDLRCGALDPSKVGPGLCKFGCGRKVAAGSDHTGRAFHSCCRGCATGGEHDPSCQQVLQTEAGKCRMGCGRPAAPGTTRTGKAFDTCCRGCASGGGHDSACRRRTAKCCC